MVERWVGHHRRRFVIVVRLRPNGGADGRPGTEGDDEDGAVRGELGSATRIVHDYTQ